MNTMNKVPQIPGVEVRYDFPIGKSTSIQVDAKSKGLVTANTDQGLSDFLHWARQNNEPVMMLGGGTNAFFSDNYFDGFIVKLGQAYRDVKIFGDLIRAGCSIPLSRLLNITIQENMTGLEFTFDIPGTLGGAVAGNAGSAKHALGEFIEAVRGFDEQGRKFVAKREGFDFVYRNSALRGKFLTHVILRLEHDKPEAIQERLAKFREVRRIQPAGVKSSGCIFKNPPNGPPAGQLIDEAGLKGFQVGGAKISDEHANYIVNCNKATAQDVLELIHHVRSTIKEQFGVELHTEVQIVESPR